VISQGHYGKEVHEAQVGLIAEVIGKQPVIKMDIHDVSDVNKPNIHLSMIEGPAHSDDFNK